MMWFTCRQVLVTDKEWIKTSPTPDTLVPQVKSPPFALGQLPSLSPVMTVCVRTKSPSSFGPNKSLYPS